MTAEIRKYVRFCPKCNENQILRSKPHGHMEPIIPEPIPFHMVSMDFVKVDDAKATAQPWKGQDFESIMVVCANS